MAREKGLTINKTEFDQEMAEQKNRVREAHKSVDIVVNERGNNKEATIFCGYDRQIRKLPSHLYRHSQT